MIDPRAPRLRDKSFPPQPPYARQNTLPTIQSRQTKLRPIPTASHVFPDGAILEMVYHPVERGSAFVLWRDGQWTTEAAISATPFERWWD